MLRLYDNPTGWRDWSRSQDNHRNKIKQIYSSTSTRLDNHLSVSKSSSRLQSVKASTVSIYGSALNLREIDRKNAKMLEKLTRMAKAPVVLKTLPLAQNRVNKRRYFLKKIENEKIHKDNINFARRLALTSSSVNFNQYQKDFEKNRRFFQIRQKFK
jgi:hypothetical protein